MRKNSTLAALALLAGLGVMAVDAPGAPAGSSLVKAAGQRAAAQDVKRKRVLRAPPPLLGQGRRTGTGWPVATDRRRARKARNAARNRRAHK